MDAKDIATTQWMVFYDDVNGFPGTDYDTGTARRPSNNWADSATIMTARGSHVLAMVPGATLTINTAVTIELVGDGSQIVTFDANVTVVGNMEVANITVTAAHAVNMDMDCLASNTIAVAATGALTVYGKTTAATIDIAATSAFISSGSVQCSGAAITIAATGVLTISGDLSSANGVTMSGVLTVSGKLMTLGTITVTGVGAALTCGPTTCGSIAAAADGLAITINGELFSTDGITLGAGGGGAAMTVNGNMNCGTIAIATNSVITTSGLVECGNITNASNLIIGGLICRGTVDNTGGNSLTVSGDCLITGAVTNTTGIITVSGNCEMEDNLSTTTGALTFNQNLTLIGSLTNDAGATILVKGGFYIGGDLSNNNAGSVITVTGTFEFRGAITNTGTITAGDVKPLHLTKDLVAANFTGTVTRFTLKGLVKVNELAVKITTQLSAGANTIQFSYTRAGGGAVVLSGNATDTTAADVQQAFFLDGTKATDVVKTTDRGVLAAGQALHMPVVLSDGVIQTVFSAGPPALGAGKISIQWEPVEKGSLVY